GVAELHLHLGPAGDDARRVRVDQDAPDRPDGARAGYFGETVVDARGEPHQRGGGVPAAVHLGRAGVVLLAGDRDPVVPVADDRLNDANAPAGRLQRAALLDMRLEIPHIALWLADDPLPFGIAGLLQRLGQLFAVAARGACNLVVPERAGERAAAEHIAVMALLVGPGDRLDPDPVERQVAGKSARRFERVDDAERAVEPAAARLRLAVRADQQNSPGALVMAEHIADAVDDR